MFRDKDYLLTHDNLIFNVLGDEHEDGKVTAGLKYAAEKKWIATYAEAVAYLQQSFPDYVDGRILVQEKKIEKHLKPLERTRYLLENERYRSPRLNRAIDLVEVLADHCDVPSSEIGITDSLLWGNGTDDSDIDLVIYGSDAVTRFLSTSSELFQFEDIQPIEPQFIQRPPGVDDYTFGMILSRKHNQGFYCGTRFAIRGVLTDEEILWCPERTEPFQPRERIERELTISNRDDSLLFPVGYDTEEGLSLVSYHIGYEMAFFPGEKVKAAGMRETSGNMERVIIGSTGGSDESICLIPTD
ncbi:hypothetical protein GC197_00795 [bacterium]|nr:hypothetical protein [bacterium]